jgi:predicted DNA-binding protein (UPF0251 family)
MLLTINTKIIQSFWRKVAQTPNLGECWIWNAHKNRQGYGYAWNGKKVIYAHRMSWTIAKGEIPNGLWVLHKCDNPQCVNPNHLFLGDGKDNAADCVSKGRKRVSIGEEHWKAKLSKGDVFKIQSLYKTTDKTMEQIAKRFKVSLQCVQRIIHGRAWRHLGLKDAAKGIIPKGYKKWPVKIYPAIANEIRRLYSEKNFTQIQIGAKFGIDQGTISRIINKKRWKHF